MRTSNDDIGTSLFDSSNTVPTVEYTSNMIFRIMSDAKPNSMITLSNYVRSVMRTSNEDTDYSDFDTIEKIPTVNYTSNMIYKIMSNAMIHETNSTMNYYYGTSVDSNLFPSMITLSNYVRSRMYVMEDGGNNNVFDKTDQMPTVQYTSNMINAIMLNYLETNFNVQYYDGIIEDNLLFQGSFFSRTRDVFQNSSARFFLGSNTGNQSMSNDSSSRYLDSFTMDTSSSDYFSTDFSSMSTAETLIQDSEQTYASILSTKLLYEVMTNSDKLMHMGSIYRMMNDFYEIKRISTTNFNDLVTSRFYSDRIFINSSDVNSDRTLISVGLNNQQAPNYREDPVFEVSTDKSTLINGDLLLGRNKWMLSFDEDSLSIKKYDPRTGRYVEKHVFT